MIAFVALTKFTSSRKGTKRNGELQGVKSAAFYLSPPLTYIYFVQACMRARVCRRTRLWSLLSVYASEKVFCLIGKEENQLQFSCDDF